MSVLQDVKIICIFMKYQVNTGNLFLYYKTMSEDNFHRFIEQMETEVWKDNFPEYEKEDKDE